MKRGRPSAPITIGHTLAGVFGLGATAPAWADRAVALSFQENPTYARITAKWADGDQTAPKITATVDSQVLVLTFDQKVAINLEALKKGLPSWAALTRMDADGATVDFGASADAASSVDRDVLVIHRDGFDATAADAGFRRVLERALQRLRGRSGEGGKPASG